ncbi:MAG: UDP-N-acetylmuramoyl-L-alanine--D-glutamate ligase [Defluviitaleaceae bacterium]|nr:UDP-N-acetylmuramoyl-L-alanine--D-glutamate ligase [Defluviitaleaceae bacterium]
MKFSNKKILVCGMARSGQAAALVLSRIGAKVCANDLKKEIDWEYSPAENGIEVRLGEAPDNFLDEFELIIISPGISVYAPFVEKAKAMCIPVWGEAELAYRLCPCPMVAITGTNGKTTVTTLVGEILKLHNAGTVIAGNIGIPLTSLVNNLSEENIVVAEISSFQLETVSAFKPKINAILNITEDHLDRHHTMENYIAAKSRIFENNGENEISVLNYDNCITKRLNPRGKIVYFSTCEELESLPNSVYLKNGEIFSEGNAILKISETKVMTENALAATAISLAAGVSLDKIAMVLRNFSGVPHRLEFVEKINGVDYYNDSKATNTDASMKALETFDRPVILIGGGYDKNTDFTPWVKMFGAKVKHLILIGQTANQISKICDDINFSSYEKADSLQKAVSRAGELAKSGDTVLFSPACASFDMFKNFEERGDMFKKFIKEGA